MPTIAGASHGMTVKSLWPKPKVFSSVCNKMHKIYSKGHNWFYFDKNMN